ncbi:TolB family protein [Bacteroidota bacterium]
MITKFVWKIIVFFFVAGLCNGQKISEVQNGPYMGYEPPGMIPEIFAPGIISTGLNELNSVFSPDGEEFYFCVRNSFVPAIFRYKIIDDEWIGPEQMPFATIYGEIDVSLSPDGSRLFYCSRKPVSPDNPPKEDYDIWMSQRNNGLWNDPVHLGDAVNSDSQDFYPIMTNSGTIYFSSQREGDGTNNIYKSKFVDGKFTLAEKLGQEINSEYREFDPFVSPDENFIIFTSTRPEGFGSGDLYISFKNDDGTWTQARNMGKPINTPGSEFCPMMSYEGKYLFFTSGRRANRDFPDRVFSYDDYIKNHNSHENTSTNIYWVDAKIIDKIKKENESKID